MASVTEPIALPRISLKERNRRWRLIRQEMEEQGLDTLILPANVSRWEQMMADSRYVTTIGGFGTETLTIMPRNGEVTAYVFNRADFWMRAQNWVKDVRDGRNHWADNAIERLNELKVPPKRIGVSGLSGLIRAPDGIVPYATVERLKQAFPAAELVNATAIIQDVRSVKSAEELELMRRSEAIIEKMIVAMTKAVRPGASERHVYAEIVRTLLENGGELPSLLIFGTGRGIGHGQFVPTDRKLKKGDLVVNELEARYAGYSAQCVAPISIGKPSAEYADLLKVSLACFENVRAKMRAGEPLGELMDTYTRTVEREGNGRYKWGHPIMHARGLGDESPALLGDSDVVRFRRIELQPGMTFILKPRVRSAKNGLSAQIGDTVLVTSKGGERLGRRKLELAIVG